MSRYIRTHGPQTLDHLEPLDTPSDFQAFCGRETAGIDEDWEIEGKAWGFPKYKRRRLCKACEREARSRIAELTALLD